MQADCRRVLEAVSVDEGSRNHLKPPVVKNSSCVRAETSEYSSSDISGIFPLLAYRWPHRQVKNSLAIDITFVHTKRTYILWTFRLLRAGFIAAKEGAGMRDREISSAQTLQIGFVVNELQARMTADFYDASVCLVGLVTSQLVYATYIHECHDPSNLRAYVEFIKYTHFKVYRSKARRRDQRKPRQ